MLCAGKAKLSTSSREGKTIITKLAEAGDVLGLNSAISNRPYEVTAEMMEPGQANFISRESLLQFLKEHGEVALRVAEQLSRNYYTAYEEIRTLGLATSPSEKFAKLPLSWTSKSPTHDNGTQLKLTLTHVRDRRDHRDDARNRQPAFFGIQENAVPAIERVHAGDPQSYSAGDDRAVLAGSRPGDLRR